MLNTRSSPIPATRCFWMAATLLVAVATVNAVPPGECVDDRLWVANDRVSTIAIVGDTLYLGGNFNYVGPPTGHGAAIDANTGAVDRTWPRVGGDIWAVGGDGAGGFYVGGEFDTVGGFVRQNLVHLLADGTVDPVWQPAANDIVQAISVANGLVYIGGEFTTIDGAPRGRMAAVTTAGELTPFDADSNNSVLAILPHQGRLFVGGAFSVVGGVNRIGLTELDPVTGAVIGFDYDINPFSFVESLGAVGPTLYIGGAFDTVGGQSRDGAAAVDSGTGDVLPWDPDPDGSVRCFAFGDNAVYMGGNFRRFRTNPPFVQGTLRVGVAAVDPISGNVLTSFNANLNLNSVRAISLTGNELTIGGRFTENNQPNGVFCNNMAVVDATTGTDLGWESHAGDDVLTLAREGDTIYAGGIGISYGGLVREFIAALDLTTGEALASFDAGDVNGSVTRITPSDNDTLYVGGGFSRLGGGALRWYLGEIDRFTGLATTWEVPRLFPPLVRAIALDADTVYVGGDFEQVIDVDSRRAFAALTDRLAPCCPGILRPLLSSQSSTWQSATAWYTPGGNSVQSMVQIARVLRRLTPARVMSSPNRISSW